MAAVGQLTNYEPGLFPLSLGLSMMIVSIAALVSLPICGAILDHTDSWLGVQLWCGVTQAVSLPLMMYSRISAGGWNWNAY
jgi:hypothetical protein